MTALSYEANNMWALFGRSCLIMHSVGIGLPLLPKRIARGWFRRPRLSGVRVQRHIITFLHLPSICFSGPLHMGIALRRRDECSRWRSPNTREGGGGGAGLTRTDGRWQWQSGEGPSHLWTFSFFFSVEKIYESLSRASCDEKAADTMQHRSRIFFHRLAWGYKKKKGRNHEKFNKTLRKTCNFHQTPFFFYS